jgi:hypothetical protein
MNLAELRDKTRSRLDDLSPAGSSYTTAQIDGALNEGLRLFALLTLCIERTVTIPMQIDTTRYQMLSLLRDWLLPLRARCHVVAGATEGALWDQPLWDSTLFNELFPDAAVTMTPVRPARLRDLTALNPQWRQDRSATIKRYGCVGIDELFVHPAPSATGTSLQLTYAAAAAALSLDTDTPETPDEDHQALVHFAVSTLPFNYGGRELQQGTEDLLRFLAIAEHRAEQVRTRSRTAGYDREPFELQAFDRSILAALMKGKKEKQEKAA